MSSILSPFRALYHMVFGAPGLHRGLFKLSHFVAFVI